MNAFFLVSQPLPAGCPQLHDAQALPRPWEERRSFLRDSLPNYTPLLERQPQKKECLMAKKAKKRVRREFTKGDVKELRAHSKARTPVARFQN
jgi:hypothetical protein